MDYVVVKDKAAGPSFLNYYTARVYCFVEA